MTIIEKEIRPLIDTFAEDLTALIRRAALEAVESAIGSGAAAPAVKRGAPSKRSAAPTPTKAASKPTAKVSKRAAAARRTPGQKRPPEELAKLADKLGAYIKAHPGLRMEAIGKGMGVATSELNLPVKKLLAAKKIRTQGQKRATEYFPA